MQSPKFEPEPSCILSSVYLSSTPSGLDFLPFITLAVLKVFMPVMQGLALTSAYGPERGSEGQLAWESSPLPVIALLTHPAPHLLPFKAGSPGE